MIEKAEPKGEYVHGVTIDFPLIEENVAIRVPRWNILLAFVTLVIGMFSPLLFIVWIVAEFQLNDAAIIVLTFVYIPYLFILQFLCALLSNFHKWGGESEDG